MTNKTQNEEIEDVAKILSDACEKRRKGYIAKHWSKEDESYKDTMRSYAKEVSEYYHKKTNAHFLKMTKPHYYLILYIAMMVFSYGHIYKTSVEENKCFTEEQHRFDCGVLGAQSFMQAIFWPYHWSEQVWK